MGSTILVDLSVLYPSSELVLHKWIINRLRLSVCGTAKNVNYSWLVSDYNYLVAPPPHRLCRANQLSSSLQPTHLRSRSTTKWLLGRGQTSPQIKSSAEEFFSHQPAIPAALSRFLQNYFDRSSTLFYFFILLKIRGRLVCAFKYRHSDTRADPDSYIKLSPYFSCHIQLPLWYGFSSRRTHTDSHLSN